MNHLIAHAHYAHGGLAAGLLLVGVLFLVLALLASIGQSEA